MTSEEIVQLNREHVFFSWSTQNQVNPIPVVRGEGVRAGRGFRPVGPWGDPRRGNEPCERNHQRRSSSVPRHDRASSVPGLLCRAQQKGQTAPLPLPEKIRHALV